MNEDAQVNSDKILTALLLRDGVIRWKNFGVIRLRRRKAITRVLNGKKILVPPRLIPEFIPSNKLKKILWQN
jgi:nucleoid DNA-binding protein